MPMPKWGAPVVALALVCGAVSGCTSSGKARDRSSAPAPTALPTKGSHADLVCGFVYRSSVETALSRTDLVVTGGLTPAASVNPDGTNFSRARCSVTVAGYPAGQALPFKVTVSPVVISDFGIVQTTQSDAATGFDYVYPTDVGVGFASEDSFTTKGITYSAPDSGLLRGDWTIKLGLVTPEKNQAGFAHRRDRVDAADRGDTQDPAAPDEPLSEGVLRGGPQAAPPLALSPSGLPDASDAQRHAPGTAL